MCLSELHRKILVISIKIDQIMDKIIAKQVTNEQPKSTQQITLNHHHWHHHENCEDYEDYEYYHPATKVSRHGCKWPPPFRPAIGPHPGQALSGENAQKIRQIKVRAQLFLLRLSFHFNSIFHSFSIASFVFLVTS